MPYKITQCYLPPGRGDIPALTAAKVGTRFIDTEVMQGIDVKTFFTFFIDQVFLNDFSVFSKPFLLKKRWQSSERQAD